MRQVNEAPNRGSASCGGERHRGSQARSWQLKASLCGTGGRCGRKLFPLEVDTTVDAAGANRKFVKVEQHALWSCKSVSGIPIQNITKLCPILKQIREMLQATVDAETYAAPDVDAAPADVVHDSMDAMRLDGIDFEAPGEEDTRNSGKRKRGRPRLHSNPKFQGQVVELRVPHESELLARRSKDARVIHVWAKPGDPRVFWLDEEDLDWLIRIMIVEYDLGGVPQLRDCDYGSVPALPSCHTSQASAASCSAVRAR